MCTVSYIPGNDAVIITSNRDENMIRPSAISPKQFEEDNATLIYPVDTLKGGTWFIMNKAGDVGVLLNGAFEKHAPLPHYTASRGTILPKIFNSNDPMETLQLFDFTGIENCTLILFVNKKLYEAKWNGIELYINQKDENKPHIWSSVTLYNMQMIAERSSWFYQFIQEKNDATQEDIIDFHSNTGKGNNEYGLQMNRNNQMRTVSITSVELKPHTASLFYKDCIATKTTQQTIRLEEVVTNIYSH